MVKGLASLKVRCRLASSRQPARYCDTTIPTSDRPNTLGQRAFEGLDAGGEGTTLALGVIPDLFDVSLVALEPKLNHDIHEQIEKLLDIRPEQLPPRRALFDQKNQLLERQFRARRMHARNRAWVSRVHVPQVIERFLRPQLREE